MKNITGILRIIGNRCREVYCCVRDNCMLQRSIMESITSFDCPTLIKTNKSAITVCRYEISIESIMVYVSHNA